MFLLIVIALKKKIYKKNKNSNSVSNLLDTVGTFFSQLHRQLNHNQTK